MVALQEGQFQFKGKILSLSILYSGPLSPCFFTSFQNTSENTFLITNCISSKSVLVHLLLHHHIDIFQLFNYGSSHLDLLVSPHLCVGES